MEKNEILFEMAPQPPYSCILDGIQFVHIKNALVTQAHSQASLRESIESAASKENLGKDPQLISLRFHYTRRMALILREEEEIARKAFEEKERKRLEAEEEHRRRYAIVEKIKLEMAEKEATA